MATPLFTEFTPKTFEQARAKTRQVFASAGKPEPTDAEAAKSILAQFNFTCQSGMAAAAYAAIEAKTFDAYRPDNPLNKPEGDDPWDLSRGDAAAVVCAYCASICEKGAPEAHTSPESFFAQFPERLKLKQEDLQYDHSVFSWAENLKTAARLAGCVGAIHQSAPEKRFEWFQAIADDSVEPALTAVLEKALSANSEFPLTLTELGELIVKYRLALHFAAKAYERGVAAGLARAAKQAHTAAASGASKPAATPKPYPASAKPAIGSAAATAANDTSTKQPAKPASAPTPNSSPRYSDMFEPFCYACEVTHVYGADKHVLSAAERDRDAAKKRAHWDAVFAAAGAVSARDKAAHFKKMQAESQAKPP
jgi:hypothetical protein